MWPDWRGQAVAIIASGPSVKKADVDLLKGRLPVLAIKKNVELAPWADAVYGCDFSWWRAVRGLPDFKGLKLAYDAKCAQYGVQKIDIALNDHRLLFDRIGLVGAGDNSGFQAINLVAQFGADRILLIGFDMQDRSGVHWYGRNMAQGQSNPTETQFRRWRAHLGAAAPDLEARGIEVVNASPLSFLKCFRFGTVEETLKRWGLMCSDRSSSAMTRESMPLSASR